MPGCYEATNTTRTCVWLISSSSGKPYYTANVPDRDWLVNRSSYQYQGMLFHGNSVSLPGNVPIYQLEKPDGGSFITAQKNEYDHLVAAGWRGKGINFYADKPNTNSGYPVYRLYSSSLGVHRWTGDGNEVNTLVNGGGYVNEGVAFSSISVYKQEQSAPDGKHLVYRFYINNGNNHLWTTDLYERDRMLREGYKYEGVAWYSNRDTTNTRPIYRIYAPSLKKHLYTADSGEKDRLVASGGWQYEGVSFNVPQSGSTPVYRLYAHSIGKHFLTFDWYERNELLRSGNWRDEGIAWYQ